MPSRFPLGKPARRAEGRRSLAALSRRSRDCPRSQVVERGARPELDRLSARPVTARTSRRAWGPARKTAKGPPRLLLAASRWHRSGRRSAADARVRRAGILPAGERAAHAPPQHLDRADAGRQIALRAIQVLDVLDRAIVNIWFVHRPRPELIGSHAFARALSWPVQRIDHGRVHGVEDAPTRELGQKAVDFAAYLRRRARPRSSMGTHGPRREPVHLRARRTRRPASGLRLGLARSTGPPRRRSRVPDKI